MANHVWALEGVYRYETLHQSLELNLGFREKRALPEGKALFYKTIRVQN